MEPKIIIFYYDEYGWAVDETFDTKEKANDFIAIHWVDITRIIIGHEVDCLSEEGPTYIE